jgi:hypothetical protein
LVKVFLTENLYKENVFKVSRLHDKIWSKVDQSNYPKLPFGEFKDKKMAELDLDSEKMFRLVNSHQSF